MINLGDKVKDKVTGFKGIVICRHEYLNGCARLTVQPTVNKDGVLQDEGNFDEPQLDLVKPNVVTGGNKDKPLTALTGGPERHIPSPRSTGKR